MIPDVPLQPGSNTLNLTASKMTGATTTATLSLTQSGTASPVSLATERDVGYAPQTIRFLPSVNALPASASVQSISVDYGDNSSPYSGSAFPQPFFHTYQQPGLYPVLLTVTDTQNNSYITKHWVIIQDVSTQRGMLCDAYGYMRQQLANQQIPTALNALQGSVRNRYQPVFSGLGSNLTAATNNLGVIVTGTLLGDTAQFLVVRERPDRSLAGFPLSFAQSTDGVWRITGM